MPRAKTSARPGPGQTPEACQGVRDRLLQSGLEIFSRYGYEGASTRRLASAAQVNLATISYHFGCKEDYYLAVAQYIADIIATAHEPAMENARAALSGLPPSREQLAELLSGLVRSLAGFMVRPEVHPIGLFILREQVFPTRALGIFQESFMLPMHTLICRILGMVMDSSPKSLQVIVRAQALIGQIVVFFTSRATILRQLGSQEFSQAQMDLVVEVVSQNIRAILAGMQETGRSRRSPAAKRPKTPLPEPV